MLVFIGGTWTTQNINTIISSYVSNMFGSMLLGMENDSAVEILAALPVAIPGPTGPSGGIGLMGPPGWDGMDGEDYGYLFGLPSTSAVSDTLFVSTADGSVTNTATEGTLIGTGTGSLTLPANSLKVGQAISIRATGHYSTQLTPTTLNIRLKLGSTTIMATGDQTPGGSISQLNWRLDTIIVVRSIGGSGTVMGQSFWEHQATAIAAPFFWEMLNTAAVTVDTTAGQAVDLTADWGAGVAAADSITCTDFTLQNLGSA